MQTVTRLRKSEALTPDEKKLLKQFIKPFPTQIDQAEALGIPRETMLRVLALGSASTKTIQKIRQKIAATAER